MRNTTGFILALAIGATSGIGLTWWSIKDGPISGAQDIGPWRSWSNLTLESADPYGRAHLSRVGDLPLAPGEGMTFTARTDSGGTGLNGQCRYRLLPIVPQARWWSLALYGEDQRPILNAARRYGFTSAEVTRAPDGSATVLIGPSARGGDWLPSAKGTIILVLRLYDTPVASARGDGPILPAIVQEGCE